MNSAVKPKKKQKQEVYKDPIYGIPHFHDPAITRIMQKHDPSFQIQESMKMIAIKSAQRLKTVQGNKPRYLHTRFNIETLITSPLMCFPHFEDMTNFLTTWYNTREAKQANIVTSIQRATFAAQDKFCNSLFLLLQETVRASPLSPRPLSGIYNWYLQRDAVINQSRSISTNDGNTQFIVIELTNGEEVKIERRFLDVDNVFNLKRFETAIEEAPKLYKSSKPIKQTDSTAKRAGSHIARIITDVTLPKPIKQNAEPMMLSETFNYEKFHQRMVEQRKSERDTELIAERARNQRRDEIRMLPGWQ